MNYHVNLSAQDVATLIQANAIIYDVANGDIDPDVVDEAQSLAPRMESIVDILHNSERDSATYQIAT